MYRTLSRSGLRVSPLAIGTATLGVAPTEDQASVVINRALDQGINVVDCANSYGNQARFDRPGVPDWTKRKSAEELVGEAIAGRRDEVVLCTKVSERIGDGPNDGGPPGGGLSRVHIMRNLERSLQRLQTDRIDIYYAHHPDPLTSPEETLHTFADLVRQGSIRHYALSTYFGWQIVDWIAMCDRLGLPKPICHQTRYSLARRFVEAEILPASRHVGLGTAAFSPLAGGLLSGSPKEGALAGDARWGGRGFSEVDLTLARDLERLSAEWALPTGQVALAWLLAQPGLTMAVVGPETVDELDALVPAMTLELSAEQLAAIEAVAPKAPSLWG